MFAIINDSGLALQAVIPPILWSRAFSFTLITTDFVARPYTLIDSPYLSTMRVIAILPLLPVNALALTLPRASTSVGDELGPHVSDDTLKVPEVRDIIDIAEVPGSSAGSVALQNAGQFLDFDAPKPSSCQAQKAKLAAVQVNTGGEKANTIPTPSPATNSSSVGASSQATPTSNAAPTSGASGTEGSVTAWLDAHNVARAEYGAAAVTWDDGLSQRAQANAVLCTHGHT